MSSQFHADVAEAIEGDREDEQAIAVLVVRENADNGMAFSLIMDPPTRGEGDENEPAPHQILMAFVRWMTATMQLGTETQLASADDEED